MSGSGRSIRPVGADILQQCRNAFIECQWPDRQISLRSGHMIVGVLALDQVMGLELMMPGKVFGMANLAAAEPGAASKGGAAVVPPKYEVRVCGQRRSISTSADWGFVERRTSYGMEPLLV